MKYFFTLLFLVTPFCLQAEVYKWMDEQGNIHYGDRPQMDDAVQMQLDTTTKTPDVNKVSREELRQRVTDSLEEDRLAKKEAREKKSREREKRMEECNWLRDKQRRFSNAGGLYKLDKDGNRVFMSDESRKKTEQDLRNKIKRACS